jgi:hypothetical protein
VNPVKRVFLIVALIALLTGPFRVSLAQTSNLPGVKPNAGGTSISSGGTAARIQPVTISKKHHSNYSRDLLARIKAGRESSMIRARWIAGLILAVLIIDGTTFLLLARKAKSKNVSQLWALWGALPFIGFIALLTLTRMQALPPVMRSPPSRMAQESRSGVPVELGIVLGILLFLFGVCAFVLPSGSERMAELAPRLGTALMTIGLSFVIGGVYVKLAERSGHTIGPSTAPAFLYILFACLCVSSTFIAAQGNWLWIGPATGGIATCWGTLGLKEMHLPRRVFGCILLTGICLTFALFMVASTPVVARP